MKLISHYIEYQKKLYPDIVNWENHVINDDLFYSYRNTEYDRHTYPSALHYHDYYELVIFEGGDIQYICEGHVFCPKYGEIVLIPPGSFHMSAIKSEQTHYKRHVFYLYPSAFDDIGHGALLSFLNSSKEGDILALNSLESVQALTDILRHLKEIFDPPTSPVEKALGFSYIIQLFYLLSQKSCSSKSESTILPQNLLTLQQYINENFTEISSVSQIAEHFFYSREYISRLFKKHFDTTISDYILKRRVEKSRALILQGIPLIDISYQVGFGSLSSFIRAFKLVTGMTPSEYRKIWNEA